MGKHDQHGEQPTGRHHARRAGAVTVADLVARAICAGEALRLAWRARDVERDTGLARPWAEMPTAVLPVVTWPDEQDETGGAV